MDCCTSKAKFPDPYYFQFNGTDSVHDNALHFESNFVRTSKYTLFSFFPVSLALQFRRVANIYFLFIAVLQSIPAISDLGPATAWAPLAVVIVISMIREGYEDYQRYKSDNMMNFELKARVKRQGKFQEVIWGELVVGDICLVEQDETFPADMLIIASAIEGGNAYIQTAGLDGQKNLKPRLALKQTNGFRQEDQLNKLQGQVLCSLPDKSLHSFEGKMSIREETKRIQFEGEKQYLYRGAKLKNTKWIYGVVIYTGRNTKIMLNSQSGSSKMSQIEVKVNNLIYLILVFQVLLCVGCAIGYGVTQNTLGGAWYIQAQDNIIGKSCIVFLSYLVLLNTMIPISLIVSIEIVKTVQGIFIMQDKLLYNSQKQKGVTVFSSSLNQELGQIQYIFSDKTGTLTCNKMEFKIAVIGQQIFGDKSLISDQAEYSSQIFGDDERGDIKGYYDQELEEVLRGKDKPLQKPVQIYSKGKSHQIDTIKDLSEEFLMILALAHECVVQKGKDGELKYQGPSPDEITLVEASKNMGFVYKRSDNQYSYLQVRKKEERVELLGIFPFTSDRKRMSILVRHKGYIKLYVKGADNVIDERLATPRPFYEKTIKDYLKAFAIKGLRTLLIGYKIVTEDQYREFKDKEAKLPQEGRAKAKEELVSNFEKNFTLIGATAVLDKLQDNVPETIRDLIRANIKIWMLTGDKLETAQNIALSCNLIQQSFQIIRFQPKTTNFRTQLQVCLERAEAYTKSHVKKAFLIEGQHLGELMKSEENKLILAELAKHCDTVVCCRLLPLQKADVVQLVKEKLNKITLSIGDGANDVPMIKMAHIGVGLYGQEGMGSVQASDYALPQFQGLWRLLLVHGRWNYLRVSEMILYFFYKNMVFTIPQFYYAFFCGFSGQSIFDSLYISLYNVVFTALPLIARAILEQDVYYIFRDKYQRPQKRKLSELPDDFTVRQSLKKLYPKIYYVGQVNSVFNYSNFFWWVIQAMLEGLLITLICIYSLGKGTMNAGGTNSGEAAVSVTCFSSIICLVTFKIAAHTKFWSWLNALIMFFLSLCLYIAFMWISDVIDTTVQGSIIPIYSSLNTYLLVLFFICVVLLIDGLILFFKQMTGKVESKMKTVINEDMISDTNFYNQISLRLTEFTNKPLEKK